MDVPLEIAFHNMEPSEAVEARVRERVAKLEKLYDRLVSCSVVVEAPHRQHRTGNIFRVRIYMSVPGGDLVVDKEPNHAKERYSGPDVYVIINDAFDVAERRLKDFKARQRGEVKTHDMPMHGHIMSIDPTQDIGFLRNAEGSHLRFHRNAVINEDLEKFNPGDPVHYVEAMGDTGPQASKVWRVQSEHQMQHPVE
ncbi:MAG TPA: HPF/RaiA family ribosome-associated protein [Azospirillaceae bacterium]|nr:HPF/RaiA family ribosome-associated protein [Azospirillaceae bacterium]